MGMIACLSSLSDVELARLQEETALIEEYLYPDNGEGEPPNYIDLDKAWHGVHYLLTGHAEGGPEPQSLAVIGGAEFGPELGYGPAQFLTARQVAIVAKTLSEISVADLESRFDAKDMAAKSIYPDVIWIRDGKEALDYVIDAFSRLQTFYRDAAARGHAVIQWIS
jgi:hypothetical protein